MLQHLRVWGHCSIMTPEANYDFHISGEVFFCCCFCLKHKQSQLLKLIWSQLLRSLISVADNWNYSFSWLWNYSGFLAQLKEHFKRFKDHEFMKGISPNPGSWYMTFISSPWDRAEYSNMEISSSHDNDEEIFQCKANICSYSYQSQVRLHGCTCDCRLQNQDARNKEVFLISVLHFYVDNEENVDEPNLEITTVSSHFDLKPWNQAVFLCRKL